MLTVLRSLVISGLLALAVLPASSLWAQQISPSVIEQATSEGATSEQARSLQAAFQVATDEEAKLTASDATRDDRFGYSLSLSGDRALIGAPYAASTGSGSSLEGSAYVFAFDRQSGTWVQEAKLTAGDAAEADQFGTSVSLSGDRALVSAIGARAAYVFAFDRQSGTWEQEAKLTVGDAAEADQFGTSVSLSGDRALVGARTDNHAGERSGTAYVFAFDAGTGGWEQEAKLTAEDAAEGDQFGFSVALAADHALVGAPYDRGDDSIASGSAYVFAFDADTGGWEQEAKLTAEDAASFGSSVSLTVDRALVGNPSDDLVGYASGSAYVFAFDAGTGAWEQEAKLTASDPASGDYFGSSVSLFGDRALVGAYMDDVTGTTWDHENSGSAYLFAADSGSGTWNQQAKLTASDARQEDRLGVSVALSGEWALAGAYNDRHLSVRSGSAYVWYTLPRLELSSGTLAFPSTGVQDSSSVTLVVTNSGAGFASLSVTSVEASEAAFSASPTSFTLPPGQSQDVTITFVPAEIGTYEGTLTLIHDASSSPTSVSLTGTSDPVALASSPETVDFGTLATGDIRVLPVELSASGPRADVTVTDVYASDPAFTSEIATPFTVTSSVSIPVSFSPQLGQRYEEWLYFEHDGTTGLDSVQVMGTGQYGARLAAFGTQTASTNFVNALFRATDASGRGLNIPTEFIDQNRDLFRVFDDGQEVSPDAPETFYQVLKLDEVPYRLRTVLLLDNSTSVGNDLPEIRQAARTIVDNLAPNQEVALYVFDSQVTLLQDFTSDPAALNAAIDGIDIGSPSTALYNGLLTGLDRWEDRFEITEDSDGHVDVDIERGFLVLLSDGEDTAGGAELSEVLQARGNKRVFAVGYGEVDFDVLFQVGSAGVYSVGQADDLPQTFARVQQEIENDARSFYLLNYSSPRRSSDDWPLQVCLRNNAYTGADACMQTSYNSTGFTDPVRGVYVNRGIEQPYGQESVNITESGVTLTATTILGLNEPVYEWSTSDPSQVAVEAIEGTNQAVVTRVGAAGGTATITVTDSANNLERTVNAALAVAIEESPETPADYQVRALFPNPSTDRVQVTLDVAAPTPMKMEVYDLLGRRVMGIDGHLTAPGRHALVLNVSDLPPAVYIVRVVTDGGTSAHPVTVVR